MIIILIIRYFPVFLSMLVINLVVELEKKKKKKKGYLEINFTDSVKR